MEPRKELLQAVSNIFGGIPLCINVYLPHDMAMLIDSRNGTPLAIFRIIP